MMSTNHPNTSQEEDERNRANEVWASFRQFKTNLINKYGNRALIFCVMLTAVGGVGIEYEPFKPYATCVLLLIASCMFWLSWEMSGYSKQIGELSNKIDGLHKQNQAYEGELDRLQEMVERTLSKALVVIFSRLSFSGDERISLFLVNENNYTIIGRYTPNTLYCDMKRVKKTVFKPFLDRAYKDAEGELFIDDLPEFDEQPHYLQCLDRNHLINFAPSVDPKNMRMKPRNLYLQTIMEDGHRVGIVVFESRKCKSLDKNKIKPVLQEEKQLIVEFIRHMRTPNTLV